MSRVFLSAPDVGELEAKHVLEAVHSGWVAPAGPHLADFEDEFATRSGRRHGVALSSGTAALHVGLLTLGVGRGDLVLTSSMTFAATANAITYVGATPFFVDSERLTGNVDVTLLKQAAEAVARDGRRIGAIVPVDLLGACADMESITELAELLRVPLLVDAAESVGATYKGRPAGSFGDASIVSFNGNKIMTTSGGGMLLTDDPALADRVRYLSTQARQPLPHYEHIDIGYNYRLSNILAALGRAQLARLDDMIARRRQVRAQYRRIFRDVPDVRVIGQDDQSDNCWLTSIVVDDDASWSAGDLADHLAEHDIETRPMWKPMHLQPVFTDAPSAINGNSEWLFRHGLTLPSGSGTSDSEFERVFGLVDDFVARRT